MAKRITIGGASGYWGESLMATPQLLAAGGLDYLVYDYLAEITMSILARARAKNADMGYAPDFVHGVVAPHLSEIQSQKVKLLANAGGVNPVACGAAIQKVLDDAGIALKVAVVTGDDLLARAGEFAAAREMFSGEAFPPREQMLSINAYLGAFPVARALAAGADIVVTGRMVDSALTLGACIHEFGWTREDWDLLAAGSLAGHILECGPQATGGNFTDWHRLERGEEIGYPIAEMEADGSFVCTKPPDTGGEVSRGTIAEQMLYELGDPQAYQLPDVVCDFAGVEIAPLGKDRVRVSGARGYPAPRQLKVCATWAHGFRGGSYFSFVGARARDAAHRFASAALTRARQSLRRANLPDYQEVSVEVLGAGEQVGRTQQSLEVVLKLAARHESERGLGVLFREAAGLGLATPAGLSGFAGTRARPSPVVRLFSFLCNKEDVPIEVRWPGGKEAARMPAEPAFAPSMVARAAPPPLKGLPPADTEVPLERLAWGRSGDKGDKANIGIIARAPEFLPYIWQALDEASVAARFAHFWRADGVEQAAAKVERFYLPGAHAINFLLHDVLGGGGVASLRNDAQGKTYAQILLCQSVAVPAKLLKRTEPRGKSAA